MKGREKLSNSFYDSSLTVASKPYKESLRNKNDRPNLLIHVDGKFTSEILANQI